MAAEQAAPLIPVANVEVTRSDTGVELCCHDTNDRCDHVYLDELPESPVQKRYTQDRDVEKQPQFHSTLCSYQGRACLNQRTVKANGQLHSLCEHHRTRAKEAQRRSRHARKKLKLEYIGSCASVGRAASCSVAGVVGTSLFVSERDVTAFDGNPVPRVSNNQEQTCMYSKCSGIRALKKNDRLHRFCSKHREMARRHQSKYMNKRPKVNVSNAGNDELTRFLPQIPVQSTWVDADTSGLQDIPSTLSGDSCPPHNHSGALATNSPLGDVTVLVDYVLKDTAIELLIENFGLPESTTVLGRYNKETTSASTVSLGDRFRPNGWRFTTPERGHVSPTLVTRNYPTPDSSFLDLADLDDFDTFFSEFMQHQE